MRRDRVTRHLLALALPHLICFEGHASPAVDDQQSTLPKPLNQEFQTNNAPGSIRQAMEASTAPVPGLTNQPGESCPTSAFSSEHQVTEASTLPLPGVLQSTKTNTAAIKSNKTLPDAFIGHKLITTIVLKNALNSHTAYAGMPVLACLKEDLIIAGHKIANRGSLVNGHVSAVACARTLSQAITSAERRYRSRGAIQIQFEEIDDITAGKIAISGMLSQQESVIAAGTPERREISVLRDGYIVKGEPCLSPEKKNVYNAARALTIAPFPASVLVNVAGPSLVMGAGAAIDPAFAYNKPVDPSQKNKRLKAFTYAFVTNLPGAFYVQSVVEKGSEIELKQGDELTLDICIKGERDQTPPYTMTNVKAVVVPDNKSMGVSPAI
jgi:hypothetical protein